MKKSVKMIVLLVVAAIITGILPSCSGSMEKPLVVAYDIFNGKFSTFFADTVYDSDVANMTQVSLLTTDRTGGIIYNAIEGETVAYNGNDYTYKGIADIKVETDEKSDTTEYRIKLREDVKFSDGHVMDADDLIFTYYVYCDPSYVGSVTLSSVDIKGLDNYRTQTESEVYERYSEIFEKIYSAGREYKIVEEMADDFWNNILVEAWKEDVESIVTYVVSMYVSESEGIINRKPEEVIESEGLKTALSMVLYGYGELNEAGGLEGTVTGKTWTLEGDDKPGTADFYNEFYAAYNGDPEKYWDTEKIDTSSVISVAKDRFIKKWGGKGGEGIKSIEGIKKIDQSTVTVTTTGYDATAIYLICGIAVAPMHYYGDEAQYDYAEGKYGFPMGDVSLIESKTSRPLGAGAYKFIKYENKVVYFEANDDYYKGKPKTKYVQFIETSEADKAASINTGTADISNPSGSKLRFEEIRSYNSNGELTGNKVTTGSVDNLGYGYIGINADTVKVGEKANSEESKALRKGFATLLSVYRDMGIESYYGDSAAVIDYPISDTSWASPRKSDSGYKRAFSEDIEGKQIYTVEMTAEERYKAALKASVGYFKAAGYTYDEGEGKFTSAPDGAKMKYEVLVPGEGVGDHPNFAILSCASKALESIGIQLRIMDLSDPSVISERIESGKHEFWTAANQAAIDPDMYQTYHSSGINGRGGSDCNYYHIDDKDLDEKIMNARKSSDQEYRKSVYKECLDIIMDWAVEIPSYQRQNIIAFSSERIDMSSVTPDITTYWTWMNEIEKITLR